MSLQAIPVSPIQRLPPDVLRYIFDYVRMNDPLGPILISNVSQLWRSVALHSPLLWSNVTIWLDNSSPQRHSITSFYFERTEKVQIALTLTIHAHRPFEIEEKEGLLSPHCHRFHSIRINASEGSVANMLWMQIGTIMPIPSLEEFETVIGDFSRFSMKRGAIADSDGSENMIIPPVFDGLVFWDLWEPSRLTELRFDTTLLFNEPDLDEIHHALSTTCGTLHHLEYQGRIGSLDEVSTGRSPLEFSKLRSLSVLCNDDMVPLLDFMSIPALDSLIIRDFITYPETNSTPDFEDSEMDVDEFTIDPNRLFLAITQWTSIKNLEIYGLDMSPDDIPSPPQMWHYIRSLNRLESLVLYGIGVATSIAHALFTPHQDSPNLLLPNLSRFLLGISEMTTIDSHDLCDFLLTRRHHRLPCLQRLSINMDYLQHVRNLNRVDVLLESSENIFVFADPEVNRFIPIKEKNLLDHIR